MGCVWTASESFRPLPEKKLVSHHSFFFNPMRHAVLFHFSPKTIRMVNLRIFHRTYTVLGFFVTLFFEKTKSFPSLNRGLGGLPPSRLKIFEIMKENSAKLVQKKKHWNLKICFFQCSRYSWYGRWEKQVFFLSGLICVGIWNWCVCVRWALQPALQHLKQIMCKIL